jgi:adenylate cyclase
VERLSSDLIELSTRHSFAFWLAGGEILRGWARSASGGPAEGISLIEDGIRHYRTTGSALAIQYWLALKAEALHLADRTFEALETIRKAEAVAEKFEEQWWCAELPRLRGVFLAAIGGDRGHIEASFHEAIRIAKQQKSISLASRAEASYTEYVGSSPECSGRRLPPTQMRHSVK